MRQDSLGAVAQTFRIHRLDDPAFILQRTLTTKKPHGRGEHQQHLIVLLEHVIGKLTSGSYFYAMHSCEYLKVSGSRKTKLFLIEDNQFHVANREIKHSSPDIFDSDTFSITIKDKKKRKLMQGRTAWRTNDPILSSVNAWASIVTRIKSYPGCKKKTPVNTNSSGSWQP
jgi:hypothetical protein